MKRTFVVVVNCALCLGGCATKAQSGTAIGTAGGAALGAGVGSLVHSSAGAGALIGAGVGAVSGAIVGNEIDQQDRRHAQELKDRAAQTQPADGYTDSATITQGQVIEWTKHGVPQQVIVDRIERSGTRFKLTAADENTLREKGVSEEVVAAMKQTARR
jgi:hypothetical protein